MARRAPAGTGFVVITPPEIDALIYVLRRKGYEVIGPTIRDGAILYDKVGSSEDLPQGWTDEQSNGKYRLKRRADAALFGYTVGPHTWKKFLFPSSALLWKVQRSKGDFHILSEEPPPSKFALLGVRACELRAIQILDKVFQSGPYSDSMYKSRRAPAFIVAVNCTAAGGTCFCESMGTGPRAEEGYDLSLTEVVEDSRHFFLAQAATKIGAQMLAEISTQPASEEEVAAAERAIEGARAHMGRSLQTSELKELLYRNVESPRWDAVTQRCVICANCTLVCPTCFCSTVEDFTDLPGQEAERIRKWDSCFTSDFSYIHGGSVRATPRSKFRQWMMHKLAYWQDQFGSFGCVGCGRCITWCPVGIDITEEARAIRESETTVSTPG